MITTLLASLLVSAHSGPPLVPEWNNNSTALEFQTAQKVPASIIPIPNEGPTKAGQFNWMKRHEAVVDRVKQGNVDLLLIGDSITHGWGGPPSEGAYNAAGPGMFEKTFGSQAVNLGFGWDSTQHVLWRLANGEVDGIKPKAAMIMIGTNNIGWTSTEDIVTGIRTIIKQLRKQLPETKVLLLGIFPRDEKPGTKARLQIAEVNAQISKIMEKNVTYLDIGPKFLEPDGSIAKETMPDFLHLSRKGYGIWSHEVAPILAKWMGNH
jgi:beta-glucosidase